MVRSRLLLALIATAFGMGFWPLPAGAASTLELMLDYWPAAVAVPYGVPPTAPSNTWTTQLWGADLRWTPGRHWGIHLKYDTGSDGNFGGFPGPPGLGVPASGRDTAWSGDLFYAWQFPALTIRGFAGYGGIRSVATGTLSSAGLLDITLDNKGFRLGGEITVPLRGSRLTFNAGAAWYPSISTSVAVNNRTFGFGYPTATGTTSASDLSASVRYAWPAGTLAEVGYRWITVNTGQLYRGGLPTASPIWLGANGPFIAVGYRW